MDRFDKYELENYDLSDGEEGGEGEEREWEYDGIEEPVMEASFEQLQHSSIADECGGFPIILSENKMSDLNKAIKKLSSDPEERFKRHISAIAYSMSESGILNLTVDERNRICRCAGYLDNVKYLNPTAFILGFFVTSGGTQIDKNKILKVFSYLPKLNDDSVKPPDVVRYSRHWMKISPCPS